MNSKVKTVLFAALLLGSFSIAEAQYPYRPGRRVVTHRPVVRPVRPVVHAAPSRSIFFTVTEMGYTFAGADFGNAGHMHLSHSWLAEVSEHLSLGAGVGVNVFNASQYYNVPLFGMARIDLPSGDADLFIDLRGGYALGEVEGSFWSPALGVRLSDAVSLSVGYELQRYLSEDCYEPGMVYHSNIHGFSLRLGFEW